MGNTLYTNNSKSQSIKFLFMGILLLCVVNSTFAQQYSEADIKVAFIYQYAQKVNWPKEQSISKFRIGVFNDAPAMEKALRSLASSKQIKNKSIEIIKLSSTNLPSNLQLLYLNPERNSKIEDIAKQARSKNILLVSDKSKVKEVVMINFLEKSNNSMNFELNRTSIIFAGLEPTKDLVLMGGREIDVRSLYRRLEGNMAKVKRDMAVQKNNLNKQKEEVTKKKKEVDKLKAEIQTQKDALEEQKTALEEQTTRLDTQESKLNELVESIVAKEGEFDLKIEELAQKEEEIKKKESLLAKQREEEQKQKGKLAELSDQIKERQSKIDNQSEELDEKSSTIDTQKNVLFIVSGFVVVIVILLFWIYKESLVRRKKNEQLKAKNVAIEAQHGKIQKQREEILTQNEELRQQQEEVIAVNESLEKQRSELHEKNLAITDSIRYAKTIQNAILPTKKYRSSLFPKSFILYRPKDIVSGDFFWMSQRDNYSFISCADCTGHGVPGAFMSMIGNNLLNAAIDNKILISPSEMLNYINKHIQIRLSQAEGKNSDGMDLNICRFETLPDGNTKLVYAGAKSPIYIIKNDELITLKGNRKSIGGMFIDPNYVFEDFEIELSQGDIVYLTTDGYIDQADNSRKRFTSKRFKELIEKSYKFPLEEQKKIFNQALDNHQAGQAQRDDITMMCIHI
jgi:serine phosphatase RsbU (regulator of sigma subunit)